MNLVIFTKYGVNGASSRVRYLQFLPLEKVDYYVSPLITEGLLKFKYRFGFYPPWVVLRYIYRLLMVLFLDKKHVDSLMVEKELFPGFPAFTELWVLKRFETTLDFDDGQHLSGSKFKSLAGVAKRVTVGSYELMEFYNKFCLNVFYYPSTMRSSRRFKNTGSFRRLLWVGSPSTSSQLDGVLFDLVHWCKIHDWKFRIVGYKGPYTSTLRREVCVELLEWRLEDEDLFFKDIDLGLMPLYRSEWNRFKCAYKIIQYMAHSIPVIASSVGENVRVINEGKNGFLVNELNELGVVLESFSNSNLEELRKNAYGSYNDYFSFEIARRVFENGVCVE